MPIDNETENTLNPREFQWVKSSSYLRVSTCIENTERLQALFNEGPCDVVKHAKSSTCGIYVEFPFEGEMLDGFRLDERNQYISRSVGSCKIQGKDIQDTIHYESAPSAIRVITVCNDEHGNFEGATTYFIERVGIKAAEDITSIDAGNTTSKASQDLQKANTQTQEKPQKESLVRRNEKGDMIPFRLLTRQKKYEADKEKADADKANKQESSLSPVAKAADSFLKGNFAQGLLDLTDEYYQAEVVGAASIVTNNRLPWLGRCTFSIGTGQDVNKKPALRMAILPWDRATQSRAEDAWECVRTCASVKDLDKNTIEDLTKQSSTSISAGTDTSASLAPDDSISSPNQQSQINKIQAQQQLGHSPQERSDKDRLDQLSQTQKINPKGYAKSLFSFVSKKFASAAGRDTVKDYQVFCKWRDVLYDTSNPEEWGLAKVSAEDMKNKHTNFRGRTSTARWILY